MTMTSVFQCHEQHLAELSGANRMRYLKDRAGNDFSSNDYLGLAGSLELRSAIAEAIARGVPVGSGGSRLLRGNHQEHELLEREAASFFGSSHALFFSSGYAANTALLSTLPQRGDLIIYDELIHASSHEGMRLSRAGRLSARHNDLLSFEDAICAWRREGGTGRIWIAVESLYSMEGDLAPLSDLVALADQHEAVLLIDEAHATGVFGEDGRGLAAWLEGRDNVITTRTCGKALGCEGALICGPEIIRDFLVNRGRPFIFSTAPSPLMAAAVRASIRLLSLQPERRTRLMALIAHAGRTLEPLGVQLKGSQILPLIIGDPGATMVLAGRLQKDGFDVRGIRPPTVPEGTSRLRISVTLNADEAAINRLAESLARSM